MAWRWACMPLVFEGERNDNNLGQATLNITYREPDLQVDNITVSEPTVYSGQPLTVSWTVTNRGTRETRSSTWSDGIYLSRDASLDYSDYALVNRGGQGELLTGTRSISLTDATGKPRTLKPGESYTYSTTFNVPESINGDFYPHRQDRYRHQQIRLRRQHRP